MRDRFTFSNQITRRFAYRNYNKPLRPIVIFTCLVSLVWSLVLAVRFLQDKNDGNETTRMRMFDLILSILFFCIAGLETFGLVATFTQKIVLAKTYFVLSGIAAIITFSAELIRLIAHFVTKSDLTNACRAELTGTQAITLSGAVANIDGAEAQKLCEDDWRRGIWWDLGWLVLTSCLALLFTGLAAAYYHQLLDPSFSRTTTGALNDNPNQASNGSRAPARDGANLYPMEPYHPMAYHTPPQDLPFVPPQYPMPPEYRQVYDPVHYPGADDKKDGLERVSLSDGPSK
ncbi:hypothetical protein O181_089908 [Austropuccinia psidii MF-1]|uniref:Uncharacterized protein n=1 Tax=Austropuccinia psidii MF-1 TaxID=1389203 RepID=A0A9Q3IU56_9BASI|nr:hypothetical protein [Austropuccinia psidii MF-1]